MNTLPQATQRGYVLITSILFLVLLTILALAAFRSTGMEAKMGANSAFHTQAFESSEAARTAVETLVDVNVSYRGWPSNIGGTISTNGIDASTLGLMGASAACPLSSNSTAGFTICRSGGTTPRDWWSGNSETAAFAPASLDQDAVYQQTVAGLPANVTGTISVYKLNTTLATGAGAAMDSGYLGLGRASSAGGGNIFFYINANGHEYKTTPQAGVNTSTIFREVIRN